MPWVRRTRAGDQPRARRSHTLCFRAGPENRHLVLTPKAQLLAATGLYGAAVLVAFAVVAFAALTIERDRERDAIASLVTRLDQEMHGAPPAETVERSEIAGLARHVEERDALIARLRRQNAAVLAEHREGQAALEEVRAERDAAREVVARLDEGVQDNEAWLAAAMREKAAMQQKLRRLEDELAEVEAARARAERDSKGLRWRVGMLEARLARVSSHNEVTAGWVRDVLGEQVSAIAGVLDQAGIDPQRLLARAADDVTQGSGQGGPLELVDAGSVAPPIAASTATSALFEEVNRLQAAHRLIMAVPLAAPLDYFHVTSTFGPRTDPMTKRQAVHSGLDFGAARGSTVMSTAPGRVVKAGRMGPYGLLVEIDHGLGITTRYAHLKEIAVEVGDEVGFRAPVGVIGNSGRSTGRHLHYEIRVDDEPLNPAGFIDAGKHLVHVFKG